MLDQSLILLKIFIQSLVAITLMMLCIFIPYFIFSTNTIIFDYLYELLNLKNSSFMNSMFYSFFDYLNTAIKWLLATGICISLFTLVISFLNFKEDKNFTLIKILFFGGNIVLILSILLFLTNTPLVMLLSFLILIILIILKIAK